MKQMQGNALNIKTTPKHVWLYFRGHYHESSHCFQYPKKSLLKSPLKSSHTVLLTWSLSTAIKMKVIYINVSCARKIFMSHTPIFNSISIFFSHSNSLSGKRSICKRENPLGTVMVNFTFNVHFVIF